MRPFYGVLYAAEKFNGTDGGSTHRHKVRLERQKQSKEWAAKTLEEKNEMIFLPRKSKQPEICW